MNIVLKHEIDETRVAGRYKFGDGGTLVSSIRVTPPVVVAGPKEKIVFSVVPQKHPPLWIGRDSLTPSRAVVENINVTALLVQIPMIEVALHVFTQFVTIAPTKPFARDVFSTLTARTKCQNILFRFRHS